MLWIPRINEFQRFSCANLIDDFRVLFSLLALLAFFLCLSLQIVKLCMHIEVRVQLAHRKFEGVQKSRKKICTDQGERERKRVGGDKKWWLVNRTSLNIFNNKKLLIDVS